MAARKFLGDIIARYLGIGGATADSTNVLSVRGSGSLYDGDSGGHQIRVNKNAAGDTASFLFQTGFSGRAEFGTIGNDDFELKVSDDGSVFTQAFVVDGGTGVMDIKVQPTILGQTVFHAGNDGAGSGLDADLLDGNHASAFAFLTGATFTGGITATTFAGNGANLTDVDAAYLGGQSPSAYALVAGDKFTGSMTFGSANVTPNSPNRINVLVPSENVGGGISFWETNTFKMTFGYDGTLTGTSNKLVILDNTDAEIFSFTNGGDFHVSGDSFLPRVGIGGATPDATNTFVFYGTNMLFNSGGNIVANFNKNAEANDASFAFQSAFTSYAQMGLLGNHDFTLKVGASSTTALVAKQATGAVELTQHPKFSGYLNYDQYNAAGAWFTVDINNTRHNDQGALSSGVFTAPHDGYYSFGGMIRHKTNGTVPTVILLGFSLNDAAPTADHTVRAGEGSATIDDHTAITLTAMMKLSAGDTVRMKAFFTGQDAYVTADENYFHGHQVP